MSIVFIGKNGDKFDLGYNQAAAISAVLTELSGRKIVLDVVSGEESKRWGDALGDSFDRIRVIRTKFHDFLILQGVDLGRMFANEAYKHMRIDEKPTWAMAEELNEDWRGTILGFADFLRTCSGIIEVVW